MPEFKALLDGYRRFRTNEYHTHRKRWERLADGQEPPIMIIGCCDSRVEPATIFDTEPGQTFVLRNVANLVPPYEVGGGFHGASAAIEFAVVHLKVRHIVVLGHGACGGVTAALKGVHRDSTATFIDDWVSILEPACERVLASGAKDPQRALELEAIRTSLSNLRTFPFVSEREDQGHLKLHGAFFAIADGDLHVLDETSGQFERAE